MLDWQWIPVIGLIALSFLVLGKRVYQLYLASQDSDAPVACGGCKGCPSSPNKVTIVELKPKSRPST